MNISMTKKLMKPFGKDWGITLEVAKTVLWADLDVGRIEFDWEKSGYSSAKQAQTRVRTALYRYRYNDCLRCFEFDNRVYIVRRIKK